jgi:pimeloyl-ACP methyl ester carboxylesterase
MKIKSGDSEIFYEVMGSGPTVVLLHAFPMNHQLWRPVAEQLASRYRLVLPDLRGLGESGTGAGPATMEKHASDLAQVCDAAGVRNAVFGGVSIGGYVLFEFWRRWRERVSALILADTRAQADNGPARAARLQAAEQVEKQGPAGYLEAFLPKLIGQSTQSNRPDVVEELKRMAAGSTVSGIAAVQRGMAERPDSVPTLRTIHVPTLLLFGDEDLATPVAEGELMKREIDGSRLYSIPRAGHLAVFEQSDAAHELIRNFLQQVPKLE